MTTNTTASNPAARQDPRQVVNTLKKTVNWNDPGIASGVAFFNALPQGAFILDVVVEIVTAFNGTSPVLTIGTNSTSFNNIVASGDVAVGAAAATRVNRGLGRAIAALADMVVYAKLAVSGSPSAGQAVIVITYEGGWPN